MPNITTIQARDAIRRHPDAYSRGMHGNPRRLAQSLTWNIAYSIGHYVGRNGAIA